MHPSLSLSLSDSEFEFEATGWMYHERFSLGVLDQDLTKTVGVSQACYWHEAWFSVGHEWAVYVFFAILTDIDERDCYLAGKLSYCCGNCFWRVFIFVSTSPLESFTLKKVAFSPSGAVPSLNSSVWFREWYLWIKSVATGKFHVYSAFQNTFDKRFPKFVSNSQSSPRTWQFHYAVVNQVGKFEPKL